MWNKVLALLLMFPALAGAQTTVQADRFRLTTGPCIERSGSGTPEGSVTGAVCDTYHRTDTGSHYLKVSGSGNTGWQEFGLSINTPGSSNLTLAPAGDLIIGAVGADTLPNTAYTQNIGALTNKFLTLHAAELWVETLVAQNTIATIGGRILVAPTNILAASLASGGTSISVKYNNFNNGDRVYMEANGSVEFMAISSTVSGSGPYTYSVTRNLDGSGANNWAAGDAIVDTGTTGNGFLDIYSTAGVLSTGTGPTIVGNVRTGTTYNAYAARWAIGNLNGLYGYASSIYGAVFGDPSATNVTVDATNGFRIRNSTTNKFVADTSGNLSIVGDLTIGTSGVLRSAAASAFGTGTGFYLSGGATPLFRVGDPTGSYMSWDGTTLLIKSSGAAGGKNQIRNSECRVSNEDWFENFYNDTGLTAVHGSSLASWRLNDVAGTCYYTIIGQPAINKFGIVFVNQNTAIGLPAQAAVRYEASAYLGTHNSLQSNVGIRWYDATGTYISDSAGNACTGASLGGPLLSGYCRSGLVATAPTGTASAQMYISTQYNNIAFQSFTFFTRMYFGEAGPYQTELSAWGPGGITEITGGTIKTGSIITANLAADSITSAKILAGTIVASDIAAGTITATQIAANTITAGQIAAGTITATEIAANTITAAKIAAGTITATEIAANTITAGKLNVSSLSAISADLGTVTAGSINIGGGQFTVDASGFLTASGATMNDLVIGGGVAINTSGPGVINLNGPIQTQFGGGGDRFLCVDNGGAVFAQNTAC